MDLMTLELRNGTKSFGSHQVLKGINFRCIQGQTVAIMGPSGSGKSTLMHVLAGLDEPTTGELFLGSHNVYRMSPREHQLFLQKNIGLLFQQPHLLFELTVIENIMLPALIAGRSVQASQEEAHGLLSAVGLAHKATSNPASLSGGQQQRVALARALINKPSFLIADEPTGNLDEKTGREIIELIIELQKKWHMGVMVSTHDQYVGAAMERIIGLNSGILS